jgi:hypothetical protein
MQTPQQLNARKLTKEQLKLNNQEKLATQDAQDEEKQNKNTIQ